MLSSAAITGGFGLANGIIGAIGQGSANKTYLRGVRETNEQNYKIWQEQQKHNIDMFNMQNDANIFNWQNQFDQTNAYNTALAQRQRLEDAGLNPALMMNGGSAGTATSSGIPTSSATPAQAPQMQAPQQVRSPLVEFAQSAINSLTGIAHAINLNEQSTTERETRQPKIDLIEAQTRGQVEKYLMDNYIRMNHLPMDKEMKWLEKEYLRKTLDSRVAYQDELQKHMVQMRIGQQLTNAQQEIINEYLPAQQQASLALTTYNAVKAYYDGKLSMEQVKTEIKKRVLIGAQISTEAEIQKTERAKRAKLASDIEVNESIIEVNGANAKKIGAEQKDIEEGTRTKKIDNDRAEKITNAFVGAAIAEYGEKEFRSNNLKELHKKYKDMGYPLDADWILDIPEVEFFKDFYKNK